MSKRIIGIDLASSQSVVATVENGKAVAIVNENGEYSTPSVIGLKDGDRKIGSAAKRQRVVAPKETINLIKRFMGLSYDECKSAMEHVQYDVVNRGGQPRVLVERREYSPEELSAMIISKLKKNAEDYLGGEVKDAVISVPAFFNDVQRQSVKTAGEIAGLNVLRIIAEPTAAMLASNIDLAKGGNYMVVDCGGATTDISIAEVSEGLIEIKANDGDVFLGGSNIDSAIAKEIVKNFKEETNVDLSTDSMAMSRILEAAEKAKVELSQSPSTEINLPYISMDGGKPLNLIQTLTRAKYERLIDDFINKVIACGKRALESANMKASDLSEILLVGGTCRIPSLQNALEKEFGAELNKSLNLDLCVAEGCAIQCSRLTDGDVKNDVLLLDVTPLNLGIETLGGVMTTMIEANTTIPCRKSETFSTAVDNQTEVGIKVLQGKRPMAKDNKLLGMFTLDGIMPAKRGIPKISVTFELDANGLLSVTAKDEATNKEQSIRIERNGGLSKEEIERMKSEAETFAEADKKAKEEAETINRGDAMVFQNEKMLEEMADKLSDDDKSKLNELIEQMKKAVSDKNIEDIKRIESEINTKWNEISTKMYSQQQANPSAETNSTTEEKKDDSNVEDASYEEVN